jgi:saccharopine dehydrogenase-like NADP-dependent oxidoreductase
VSTFSLLVIGCGDLGGAVAAQCAATDWTVWGLRRSGGALPAAVQPISADVTAPETLAVLADIAPTHVLMALSPAEFTDQAYRRVYVARSQQAAALVVGIEHQRLSPGGRRRSG